LKSPTSSFFLVSTEIADQGAADLVAHVAQALAEVAQALARPQQRRLRIAARRWLEQ
jgi:hypothetical protein